MESISLNKVFFNQLMSFTSSPPLIVSRLHYPPFPISLPSSPPSHYRSSVLTHLRCRSTPPSPPPPKHSPTFSYPYPPPPILPLSLPPPYSTPPAFPPPHPRPNYAMQIGCSSRVSQVGKRSMHDVKEEGRGRREGSGRSDPSLSSPSFPPPTALSPTFPPWEDHASR